MITIPFNFNMSSIGDWKSSSKTVGSGKYAFVQAAHPDLVVDGAKVYLIYQGANVTGTAASLTAFIPAATRGDYLEVISSTSGSTGATTRKLSDTDITSTNVLDITSVTGGSNAQTLNGFVRGDFAEYSYTGNSGDNGYEYQFYVMRLAPGWILLKEGQVVNGTSYYYMEFDVPAL